MCDPYEVDDDKLATAFRQLQVGARVSFADPLDSRIPRVSAGCYTIWDPEGRFIYAGMAGRSLTSEAVQTAVLDPRSQVTGLRDRLANHRAGRRSGDQFCVYVFDRFVLLTLSGDDIDAAAAGEAAA